MKYDIQRSTTTHRCHDAASIFAICASSCACSSGVLLPTMPPKHQGPSEQALQQHRSMTHFEGECWYSRANSIFLETQRGSSGCSEEPACLNVQEAAGAEVQRPPRAVASQVEIGSKARKRFIIFQLQALNAAGYVQSRAGSTWGGPAAPYRAVRHDPARLGHHHHPGRVVPHLFAVSRRGEPQVHVRVPPRHRGLHSSTFRLNVNTFCWLRWVHDSPPVY